jgi:hypothetical protein
MTCIYPLRTVAIEKEEIILVIGSSTMRALELIQDPRIRTCIKPATTYACFSDPTHPVTTSIEQFLRKYTSQDHYNVLACLVYFGNSSRYPDGSGLMAVYAHMFEQLRTNKNTCYKPVVDRAGAGVAALIVMIRKYLHKSKPVSLMHPLPSSYSDKELVPYMLKYKMIPADDEQHRGWVDKLVRRMNGNMWTPMHHINRRISKVVSHEASSCHSFDVWAEITGGQTVVQGQRVVLDAYSNTDTSDISCHLNFEALLPVMLRLFSEQTSVKFKFNLKELKRSRELYEVERGNRPHKQPDFQAQKCMKTSVTPIAFVSGGML